MTVKSKIYFAILFVVGLASVTFIYYRITGQDIFTIFRQETVTPVAKPNEPKLTVEIQRSGGEDVLIMRWDNIPANTARINILPREGRDNAVGALENR